MKILIIIIVFVLWSLWGYFSSRVEQVEYTVIEKVGDYEIRDYSPHIGAQVVIQSSNSESMDRGFGIIARYISGDNTKKQSIAMTAPVKEQGLESEKISMTAPVVAKKDGDSKIISFVMPKEYTLETLPTPNDPRIKLVEVPEKRMAALRFSWFRGENRIIKMEEKLLSYLNEDDVEIIGSPSYAGYNAPWTPPWMNRNEILVEINK